MFILMVSWIKINLPPTPPTQPPPPHLGRGIHQPAAIQIQLRGTEVSGQELREGLANSRAHVMETDLMAGWWFFPNPSEKICASRIGSIFRNFRGENNKIFETTLPRMGLKNCFKTLWDNLPLTITLLCG